MQQYKRGVHIDFHTSPYIPDIGTAFDKKQFQEQLIKGRVQTIALFAKCHHGYCYYPTKVGTVHPNLNFDLLGSQIQAAREIGVRAVIYLPIGWSALDCERHPEWRAYDFGGKNVTTNAVDFGADKNSVRPFTSWVNLCPTGDYLDHIAALTKEICDLYGAVDGFFYDICFWGKACSCPRCVDGMKKIGLNPDDLKDSEIYFEKKRVEMMERLNAIAYVTNPDASVFYNGSTVQNNPAYMQYQSHFEIEVLPTCGGEFDDTDFHVRKLEKYGKSILGMTGKFMTCWGEYGGYKSQEALVHECFNCQSLGIGTVVGDHCHPDGKLDSATYAIIGEAFSQTEKTEKFVDGTTRVCDVGAVMSNNRSSNLGVNAFLLENKIDYKIVVTAEDLSGIKLLILPDGAIIDEKLSVAVKDYILNGGAAVVSGSAIKSLEFLGVKYVSEPKNDCDYVLPDVDVGLFGSAMLINKAAHVVDADKSGFVPRAKIFEPYFNRTYERYSGHRNAPNKRTAANYYALLKKDEVAYFANDVFAEYAEYGSVYVRRWLNGVLDELYPERIVTTQNLPLGARVRLRKNEKERYYALYLLYAPQTKRENCYVLEDFPALSDSVVSLSLSEKIKSVKLQPENLPIAFSVKNGKTQLTVDEWSGHRLIVLEY